MQSHFTNPEPIHRVVGLDISLTGTGYADWLNDQMEAKKLTEPKGAPSLPTIERVDFHLKRLMGLIGKRRQDTLTVIEAPAFSRQGVGHVERLYVYSMVIYTLWCTGQQYLVVGPTTLKKFVTGKGNAPKSVMVKYISKKPFEFDTDDDNVADAVGLAHMGLAAADLWAPTNNPQREALKTVVEGQQGY